MCPMPRGVTPPEECCPSGLPLPRTLLCAMLALSRAAATARRTSLEIGPGPDLGVRAPLDAGSSSSKLKRTRLPR